MHFSLAASESASFAAGPLLRQTCGTCGAALHVDWLESRESDYSGHGSVAQRYFPANLSSTSVHVEIGAAAVLAVLVASTHKAVPCNAILKNLD